MDFIMGIHDYFYKTLGMGNAFYYAIGFVTEL